MATDTRTVATSREVIDPVCGMTITPADAVGSVDHDGQTYYFCHESCLERFRANPQQFVGSPGHKAPAPYDHSAPAPHDHAAPAPQALSGEYACPMDPEVRQIG